VSPARGGEADQFGNRYEGRWTVAAMLRIPVGHATSIVVEQRGEAGKGVEFVVTRSGGIIEAYQVKCRRGANKASLAIAHWLLVAVWHMVQDRRGCVVSAIGARKPADGWSFAGPESMKTTSRSGEAGVLITTTDPAGLDLDSSPLAPRTSRRWSRSGRRSAR
jgi:hypothetical protein